MGAHFGQRRIGVSCGEDAGIKRQTDRSKPAMVARAVQALVVQARQATRVAQCDSAVEQALRVLRM